MASGTVTDLTAQFSKFTRLQRMIRHRLLRGAAVPPGTIGVLTAISRTEPGQSCHGKTLVARCGLDASTVSRSVSTLVERGLVVRDADPTDGRAITLRVTPAGEEVLADTERWLSELLAGALNDWTPAEIDAFTTQFDRLLDALDSALHHAPAGPAPLLGSARTTEPIPEDARR